MNNRRSFLKNTALGALGLGLSSKADSSSKFKTKDVVNCNPTTLDFYGQGPFYTENPPMIEGNQLAGPNEAGQKMIISGRIHNLECNEFIPNTVIDVWHANDAGQYDNQGYNLRGYTTSNDQGFYLFETIKPGKYLNGNTFRPSHIHIKITPPGFNELTTQIYFEGDTSIPGDPAASKTSGIYDATNRIITLNEDMDGTLHGTFDVVIDGDGISVNTKDIHLDRGMIYTVSPNPFQNQVEIEYGVFKKAKVGLVVYDLQGRMVATLEDEVMNADKYRSIWQPNSTLASGYYFVALRVNDLQVHYLRLVKM